MKYLSLRSRLCICALAALSLAGCGGDVVVSGGEIA